MTEIDSTACSDCVLTVAPCVEIKRSAYRGRKDLKKVILPKDLKQIGDHAFDGCENMEAVEFPEGLRAIGHGAFNGCKSLRKIILPASLEFLGNRAFGECLRLEYVEINHTLTKEAERLPRAAETAVFFGCAALKELYVADGVTRLSYYMFAGCKALNSVRLPRSLIQISNTTFEGVPAKQFNNKLRIVRVKGVGKVLANAFNVKGDITVPGDVVEIGYCAFYGQKPNRVIVENGVRSIGSYAFGKYGGLPLILPPSVKEIAWDAFDEPSAFIACKSCHRNGDGGWGHQYATPRYDEAQYENLVALVNSCEAMLLNSLDINVMLARLDDAQKLGMTNLYESPSSFVARRLREIQRICNVNVFKQVKDKYVEQYLDIVFTQWSRGGAKESGSRQFFIDVIGDDEPRSADWRNRRLKFLLRVMNHEVRSSALPLICHVGKWWSKSKLDGMEHEWMRIRDLKALHSRAKIVRDSKLIKELSETSYSRSKMMLEIAGVNSDRDALSCLVKARAAKNIVALYKRRPEAEAILKKSDLLLHACLVWNESETATLIQELIQGGFLSCDDVHDAEGNGPLLYVLYNVLTSRPWKLKDDAAVKMLVECGCDPNGKLVFGYSYNDIVIAEQDAYGV